MKTALPEKISTVEEAKTFLTALVKNEEVFHPEDDAHDIIWRTTSKPSPEECDRLNALMEDIYNLPGNDGKHDNSIAFCPCGFILDFILATTAAKENDLDEACRTIQNSIGQEAGDAAGIFFSKFDQPEMHWLNAGETERIEILNDYIAFERKAAETE